MTNNQSVRGFWRGWHASFNRWLLRYLYLPLGGGGSPPSSSGDKEGQHLRWASLWQRTRRWLNPWIVFGFVALWHDLEPKLFAWAGLNAAALFAETLWAELRPTAAAQRGAGTAPGKPASVSAADSFGVRTLAAVGSAGYMLFLLVANLVGYGVGLGGTADFMTESATTLAPVGGAFLFFFATSHIMAEANVLRAQKSLTHPLDGALEAADPASSETRISEGSKSM